MAGNRPFGINIDLSGQRQLNEREQARRERETAADIPLTEAQTLHATAQTGYTQALGQEAGARTDLTMLQVREAEIQAQRVRDEYQQKLAEWGDGAINRVVGLANNGDIEQANRYIATLPEGVRRGIVKIEARPVTAPPGPVAPGEVGRTPTLAAKASGGAPGVAGYSLAFLDASGKEVLNLDEDAQGAIMERYNREWEKHQSELAKDKAEIAKDRAQGRAYDSGSDKDPFTKELDTYLLRIFGDPEFPTSIATANRGEFSFVSAWVQDRRNKPEFKGMEPAALAERARDAYRKAKGGAAGTGTGDALLDSIINPDQGGGGGGAAVPPPAVAPPAAQGEPPPIVPPGQVPVADDRRAAENARAAGIARQSGSQAPPPLAPPPAAVPPPAPPQAGPSYYQGTKPNVFSSLLGNAPGQKEAAAEGRDYMDSPDAPLNAPDLARKINEFGAAPMGESADQMRRLWESAPEDVRRMALPLLMNDRIKRLLAGGGAAGASGARRGGVVRTHRMSA